MAKDVKVQIVGDASKFKSALADASSSSDKFSKKTKDNGESMSKFGLGALAVGGAIGVGLFKAGEAASNLGESVNAVRVTFGKSADGILKLGEDAATAVGLSNTAFNGLAVQFSSFATTVAGKGGDVVGVMSDMTGRAADFASVMNIDVAEAAAMFQSGLAGETEPLKKFGLDLSAAAVTAYAAANGIGEVGKELTEAEKVTARYGLLMESTAKTQGDFANTADSAANATRIAKAEFENAAASLGAVVAPIMAEVASKAADLAKGFVDVNEATGGALVGFTAIVGGGALLLGTVTSIIGRVRKMQEALHGANGELTGMGKVSKVAAIGLGVAAGAMLVYSINAAQNAKEHENLANAIAEVSRASDADLMKNYFDVIANGLITGKDLTAIMDELARANLDGAKRLRDFSQASIDAGTGTKLQIATIDALNAAIAKEDAAVAQAAKTTKDATAATEDSTAATELQEGALKIVQAVIDEVKESTAEATRKSDAFAESIRNQREKLNDLYGIERSAVDAKYDYADSQAAAMIAVDEMNTTLKTHKEGTEEATTATRNASDAILDQSEKYATLKGAALDSEGGIRRQIESLKAQAASLAPGSELRMFLEQYIADLKAIPSNVDTFMNLHVSSSAVNPKAPGYIPRGSGGIQRGAEGGIVKAKPGGQLLVAGEAGSDEALIPLDGKHGMGGSHTVNLTVNAGLGANGYEVAKVIVNNLAEYDRRNGTNIVTPVGR